MVLIISEENNFVVYQKQTHDLTLSIPIFTVAVVLLVFSCNPSTFYQQIDSSFQFECWDTNHVLVCEGMSCVLYSGDSS